MKSFIEELQLRMPTPFTIIFSMIALIAVALPLLHNLASEIERLDYDTATLAIFINNLIYHNQYDFNFTMKDHPEDLYRIYWAANSLPWTWPLSKLIGIFTHDPHDTPLALVITSIVLAVAGSALAADLLIRNNHDKTKSTTTHLDQLEPDVYGRIFIICVCLSFPTNILFIRTGFLSFWLPYFLFWLTLNVFNRFLDSQNWVWTQIVSICAALLIIIPYPSTALCAILAAPLLLKKGTLTKPLFRYKIYAILISIVIYFVIVKLVISLQFGIAFSSLLEYQIDFIHLRSNGFNLATATPIERFIKLYHQLITFNYDALGDKSRDDHIWTMGAPNWAWIIVCLGSVFGFLKNLNSKAIIDQWISISLLIAAFIFLFLIFPEGRYIACIIPLIIAAAQRAIIVSFRNSVRIAIYTTLVLCLSAFNILNLESRDADANSGRPSKNDWAQLSSVLNAVDVASIWFPSPRSYKDVLNLRLFLNREINIKSNMRYDVKPKNPNSSAIAILVNVDSIDPTLKLETPELNRFLFCLPQPFISGPCQMTLMRIIK